MVEKKKKKGNRASLLKSLAQVQATPDEVNQLTAISIVQTIGLRKLTEQGNKVPILNNKTSKKSIAGAKKRLRLLKLDKAEKIKKTKYDPNIVSTKNSSSEESSSESDKDEPDVQSHEGIEKIVHNNTTDSDVIEVDDNYGDKIVNNEMNVKSKEPHEEPNKKIEQESCDSGTNIKEVKEEKKPLYRPTKFVQVKRDPKVQVARLKLPILGEEQRIMELINENEIIIVAGETGSGKTTQIPQFLYEAGYTEHKMIGVTQPRRVATVAMAARVGYELGLTDKEVSYLMRFEGNVTEDTQIKFMTDGVLFKEIQVDHLLSKYSVIILDEAHERSMYTDILLGLLSRIVRVRHKRGCVLRLIIMSATLRFEDFTENTRLFKVPPPVINIESRQFPVTIHFNKRTNSDYLKEAFNKTVKIHTRLPQGGILIFVTGRQEVDHLVRKLKGVFPYRRGVAKVITKRKPVNKDNAVLDSEPDDIESDDDEVEKEMKRALKARRKARSKSKVLPKINLDDYDMPEDDGQADLVGNDHLSDSTDSETEEAIRSCRQHLWVLPLYSRLNSKEQSRVFKRPPTGARLCVVSTDVAETSLTIPSIKYVVDTGKKKMRVYDEVTGASAWRIVWASQASAGQRAGRAGRTAPGHVYRLYSTSVFQHECAPQYPPDLCRRPLDDLILQMKCMGIDKVVNFPFPTAPDRMQLHLAEKRLKILGLLDNPKANSSKRKDDEEVLRVTPLGKAASEFPLLPRYGIMLVLGHHHNMLPYTIALVAALSVPEVMSGKSDKWPATGHNLLLGDPGVLLRVVGGTEYARFKGEEKQYCAKYGIREDAIKDIRKIRNQLTQMINRSVAGVEVALDPEMKPPDDNQARFLRHLILNGHGDQVARKIRFDEIKEGVDKRKFKYAYHCGELEEPVYLHSDSILRGTIPEWVVYQELYETGMGDRRKMIMSNVTAIEPEWLPLYFSLLCNLGEPLSEREPWFDEKTGRIKCLFKGTFGKAGWELPTVELNYPEQIEKYKWFARYLLEGVVFPKLKKYVRSLLSPPSTMIKSWAKLQPRTEVILKALIARRIGTRDELKTIWKTQSSYLLNEYLKWVPKSAHYEVRMHWPPL